MLNTRATWYYIEWVFQFINSEQKQSKIQFHPSKIINLHENAARRIPKHIRLLKKKKNKKLLRASRRLTTLHIGIYLLCSFEMRLLQCWNVKLIKKRSRKIRGKRQIYIRYKCTKSEYVFTQYILTWLKTSPHPFCLLLTIKSLYRC